MFSLIARTIIMGFLLIFPSPVFAQQATLSLSPSSGTFNKGCNFNLDVSLDTSEAQTDGADAILIYDTSKFSASSVTNGTIYPDYPGSNIDETSGKITISGLASLTTPFTGKGTLATVNFKVKDNVQTGATQIKFDFDPNDKSKTTDSNVVERGTVSDILNSVVNGSYTIGAGTCVAASPTPGLGATGLATPSASPELPPAGSEQLTVTLAITGVVLTILGILGLALL